MKLLLRSGGKTKLPCWFAECFHGPTAQITVRRFDSAVIAWWAMPRGFMFTLDPTVAENLLKAIQLEAHASFWDSGRTHHRRLLGGSVAGSHDRRRFPVQQIVGSVEASRIGVGCMARY
jgi:hypothetical protein